VEKLNSGFSYVRDENGNNIRSVSQVKKDDLLSIHVRDGVIKARVD
jgi:exodeoxyribonuclease VII large subunit